MWNLFNESTRNRIKKIAARISHNITQKKEGERKRKRKRNRCEKNFAVSCSVHFFFFFSVLCPLNVQVSACSRVLYILPLHIFLLSHKCLLLWNSLTSFAYENIYQKYSSCLTLIDNNNREWRERERAKKWWLFYQ